MSIRKNWTGWGSKHLITIRTHRSKHFGWTPHLGTPRSKHFEWSPFVRTPRSKHLGGEINLVFYDVLMGLMQPTCFHMSYVDLADAASLLPEFRSALTASDTIGQQLMQQLMQPKCGMSPHWVQRQGSALPRRCASGHRRG